MDSAFQPFGFESGFFENGSVREEIDLGSCLFCPAQGGEKAVFQFNYRDSFFVGVVMDVAVLVNLDVQMLGQGVDYGGAYSVKASAGFVGLVVEFSSCVEGGQDDTLGGDAFFVHSYRDSPAAVFDGAGAVGF